MLKDGLAHTVSARRRSPVSDDVDGDGV
jgi:hypothetical protein